MDPLRHFYGFRLSIDLLLWEKRQQGHRARNSLNACVSQVKQTPGMHRNGKGKDMNSLTLEQIDVQSDVKASPAQAVRTRKLTTIYSVGAIIGLFGSAAVSLFGTILTGASWFVAKDVC
jgi:DNA-binding SARP family transcriptional activator